MPTSMASKWLHQRFKKLLAKGKNKGVVVTAIDASCWVLSGPSGSK
jgi:hypothetical protein